MASGCIKLVTMIILGMILIQPLAVYAYNDIPLHEDPEAVGTEIDASLLFYYALLFRAILYPEDYNLTALMELYGDMYIPTDLEYILSRMNELVLSLDSDINETRFHIDHALDYIGFKAFKEALEELYEARVSLAHANITYQDLLNALDELLRSFAKYKVADERFTEARDELKNLSKEIEALLRQLLEQIESLEEEGEYGYQLYYEGKEETYLTIYVNSTEAWIGSYIEVYGALYTSNMSLSYREVRLRVMGTEYYAITNVSGEYSLMVRLPYVYRDRAVLTVYYIPTGADEELYTPVMNQTVLRLLYIKTRVSIEVDDKAYPGLPLNITIGLSPSAGNVSRRVSLYIDDVFVGRYPVRDLFSTSIVISPDIGIGRHVIGVAVEPYKEYSPARAYRVFTVTYKEIYFEMDVSPKVLIYPLVKPTVHGRVLIPPDKPYADRLIRIYVGSKVFETYTSGIGFFSLTVDPPFTLTSFDVKATIYPDEPWYPRATRVVQVYVVNLYLLILIGVFLIACIYVINRLVRGRRVEAVEKPVRGERRIRVVEDIIIPTRVMRRPRPPVERNPIVDLYYSIVDIISDKESPPRYDETLREYFRRVSHVLGDAKEAFWRLTLMAERFLYSGYMPSEEDIALARRYHDEVRRIFDEG